MRILLFLVDLALVQFGQRFLKANELISLGHIAKAPTLDKAPQRRQRNAKFIGYFSQGHVSAKKFSNFNNPLGKLVILAGSGCRTLFKSHYEAMLTESGAARATKIHDDASAGVFMPHNDGGAFLPDARKASVIAT
jgi:hypothetical protein